ncbi:fumarylacetoacetate hydrolase family protein [Muricoccus aerilatus]|uniref:fumarylacetoacetate hydrolase family protein n=1 Tax=Muricoccus aerilatus TaxID=452982 RepID=UPI0005C194AE|nr:fumarylacetoacetate hydrolase family protein [Roseomonas aerilata]
MRLARFEFEGRPGFGVVNGNRVFGPAASGATFEEWLLRPPAAAALTGEGMPLQAVTLLPPLLEPANRIFALGWSYLSHQEETDHKKDPFPFFFLKDAQSLVGQGASIRRPRLSETFDFEGEFAVVIGKSGRHIPEDQALEHVAGYSILMDGSVREWQKHSVTAGKNFDASSAYGPWIVTRDEISDPHDLRLTTRLNDQVVQDAGTGTLAWRISYLIHYCSSFTKLRTGDVISTGTPGGVGSKRTPPLWLKPGDKLEVEVSGIGTLFNTVREEGSGEPG